MRPAILVFGLIATITTVSNLQTFEYDPEAFWTMVSVWVTTAVGFVAFHQISEARKSNERQISATRESQEEQMKLTREENTKERTLNACLLFDHDPVIVETKKALYEARLSGELDRYPRRYREDLLTMLNYFDVIAIGIDRKIYDEDIARDHLEGILRVYLRRFFHDKYFTEDPPLTEDYGKLVALADRWKCLTT